MGGKLEIHLQAEHPLTVAAVQLRNHSDTIYQGYCRKNVDDHAFNHG